MFFKEIYGMLTDGTELGMNIRRTGGGLAVSVMPKSRDGGEAARLMVPLVASGTPEELDDGLLAAIAKPLAKATGLIMNIAEFERQAAKAAEKAKSKVPSVKETKEEREKREKLERTLKRADEAASARRFAESLALLKHVLTTARRRGRRKSRQGCRKSGGKPKRAASLRCSPDSRRRMHRNNVRCRNRHNRRPHQIQSEAPHPCKGHRPNPLSRRRHRNQARMPYRSSRQCSPDRPMATPTGKPRLQGRWTAGAGTGIREISGNP